jgi:hypothetical protein
MKRPLPSAKENCPLWGEDWCGCGMGVIFCYKIPEDYLSFYGNILIKPHRAGPYHRKRAFDYSRSGSWAVEGIITPWCSLMVTVLIETSMMPEVSPLEV